MRIATRTGINSGEVVAGDPSGGQALVTGDAVNVAARLAAGGRRGRDPDRRARRARCSATGVESRSRSSRSAVRGKEEPLTAWTAGRRPARSGRGLGPAAPMLGPRRGAARAARGTSSGSPTSAPRNGSIVLGPGRHRQVAARAASCGRACSPAARPCSSGRCLPYGEGITFWPLAEIVRQLAGGTDPRAARSRRCSPATRTPR